MADAGLFAAILVAYLVPVSSLLVESRAERIALAVAVPLFFASVLFIRTFAAAGFRGAALGSNLFGALVGGLLESLSMWIGLRSLLFIALRMYVLAYLCSLRTAPSSVRAAEAVPVS